MYPKVLLLSNNPFSKASSNGRTIGNFFLDWPSGSVANIFTSEIVPDLIDCPYFRITDGDVKNSLLHLRHSCGHEVFFSTDSSPSACLNGKNFLKKNPLTCLLRNFAWKTNVWSTKSLWKWIKSFSPEILLLQAGDAPFMFDIARKISRRLNIPLTIFNTEDYYFKTWNYLHDSNGHKRLYPLFRRVLCKSIRKGIESSSLCIYNSNMMENDYVKAIRHYKSAVLYTSTAWTPSPYFPDNHKGKIVFSYFGSVVGKRHISLIQMAEAIHSMCSSFEFNVYGNKPTPDEFKELLSCKYIKFHEPVSYEKVRMIAEQSDVLVHAENFDSYYVSDRKHEFSTKIADCLASGRCFLVYAPKTLAFVKYLQEYDAAFVATSYADLLTDLNIIIGHPKERTRYLPNAQSLVEKNHTIEGNREKMLALLRGVLYE